MNESWKKLEAWLAENDPARLADLNPPASPASLLKLENTLSADLPAAFVDCLRAHDGQFGRSGFLFDGYQYLSSKHIAMAWTSWTQLLEDGDFDGRVARSDNGIRPLWWCRGWVPFASNGGGDHLCLDLQPAPSGQPGQIIEVLHDVPQRLLLAASFSTWFDDFIQRISA